MLKRRDFLAMSGAASVMPLAACSVGDIASYDEATARLRATLSSEPDMLDLIRFATLAANGHNTQPWRFAIDGGRVAIRPDMTRRTPVVDPDDHHLYVSLGCAAENLMLAAAAHGRPSVPFFEDAGEGQIVIDLVRAAANASDLYQAIPERQSTRSEYDGSAVSAGDLDRLAKAAQVDGVSVELITGQERLETILDFIIQGNSIQVDDPAFVQELKDWVRFNPREALATGDGLFSGSSGNPTLPSWMGRALFGFFFDKDAENEKYATHMRSSAGVAVFTGESADPDHWVRVGRSFQRFALQATVLGIRHAHVNQPVEVPAIRTEFAKWLGAADRRPDLVVRFGYAPPLPMSMRRPVKNVLEGAS